MKPGRARKDRPKGNKSIARASGKRVERSAVARSEKRDNRRGDHRGAGEEKRSTFKRDDRKSFGKPFRKKEFKGSEFRAAMNDDLAVPQALAFIAESMRIGNSAVDDKKIITKSAGEIRGALSILGCDPQDQAFATSKSNDLAMDGLIKLALEQREAARARKDFKAADQIRDQIASLGITVEDTPNGPRWSY